jgi:hypothetical protein
MDFTFTSVIGISPGEILLKVEKWTKDGARVERMLFAGRRRFRSLCSSERQDSDVPAHDTAPQAAVRGGYRCALGLNRAVLR